MKKKKFLFLCLTILLFGNLASFAQHVKSITDSSTFTADTSKINALLKSGSMFFRKGQVDEAEKIAAMAEAHSKKLGYQQGYIMSLNLYARVYYRRGNYDSSVSYSSQALKLAQQINDSVLQSSSLIALGSANSYMGNNNQAIDYYFKGLAIEEKLKQQENLQWYFNNIGNVFSNMKNYPKALEYTIKAKNIVEKSNDKKYLGMVYNNIGWIYMLLEKNDSARFALEKSLKIAEGENDKYSIALCLDNLSQLFIKLKQFDKAYEYSTRSYEISKQQGLKEQTVASLIALGTIQIQRNRFTEAENDLNKAMEMAKSINSKALARDAALQFARLYHKQEKYKQAHSYYKIYSEIKDTLLNEENSKLLTEMNTKYTTEKKEKEIELLKKNEDIQSLELSKKKNELERQRTVSISIFAGFLLLMIVAILLFSRYRLKKKANDQLQTAFNLIEEKNTLIEKSNVMITDSITYAKRIQDAILPASEDLTELFSDNFFILYQPSQIVSGDFYWCSTQQDKIIFVVADCTGHGVPGAFMSMIGNTLLNEIVNERKVTDTKKIAELLDEKIIYALHQHEGSQKYDGMDISICCIDKLNKQISFTGAHHFMYASTGAIRKIKGDPYSIGGAQQQNVKTFTSQTLTYEKGLSLYFLTDGYCDQAGGDVNKRFSSKKFEILLNEIQHLSMHDQKEKLEHAFEQWKGSIKQRDDVLVVGIKC